MFKCGIHNFETDSLEQWRKHESDEVHTRSGQGICNYCGLEIEYRYIGKMIKQMEPVICKDCKTFITKSIKNITTSNSDFPQFIT